MATLPWIWCRSSVLWLPLYKMWWPNQNVKMQPWSLKLVNLKDYFQASWAPCPIHKMHLQRHQYLQRWLLWCTKITSQAGSQPAPLKITNPNNLQHANVSEQYAMLASKVVAFSADTVAGHTAETGTSVKPASDDFIIVTRKKQGDNWVANPGTNPTQTMKPKES